jgi:prefoldin subunit 5
MAKALLGHVGTGLDVRISYELKRLRDRVRELETEVIRLRAENTELRSINGELSALARVDEEMLRLSVEQSLTVTEQVRDHEPALT